MTTQTSAAEPTTEAGRRLLTAYAENAWPIEPQEIAAIEAEARASAPLDETTIKVVVIAALRDALGEPADGMSRATRRAIAAEVAARLTAEGEKPHADATEAEGGDE